ncbi:hypothetical protein QBC47DRAFT_10830 [Echria macrotheca]|uniref:Uncharacterized protein n=1 Tax=Echria macrotheca TaxID=438768 RepID=A0AAJ0BRC8_9PEZI|nr:hypothetical protein QBC47DRAFT_10830 [Echria macrotheca]
MRWMSSAALYTESLVRIFLSYNKNRACVALIKLGCRCHWIGLVVTRAVRLSPSRPRPLVMQETGTDTLRTAGSRIWMASKSSNSSILRITPLRTTVDDSRQRLRLSQHKPVGSPFLVLLSIGCLICEGLLHRVGPDRPRLYRSLAPPSVRALASIKKFHPFSPFRSISVHNARLVGPQAVSLVAPLGLVHTLRHFVTSPPSRSSGRQTIISARIPT